MPFAIGTSTLPVFRFVFLNAWAPLSGRIASTIEKKGKHPNETISIDKLEYGIHRSSAMKFP